MHRAVIVRVALLAFLTVWLVGCGGRTYEASRDVPVVGRVLAGVVNAGVFAIGPGERVGCRGDVVIHCSTAIIEGELVSLPPSGAGQAGGSITVQATGDVTISGRVEAGDGTDGQASGEGGDGGKGGTVIIKSSAGSVTVGGATEHDSPGVVAGDGGNGGNGKFGGAGGAGGGVGLFAPTGTLTIRAAAGLLHAGDGGNGGQGVILTPTPDMLPLPEPIPNAGGDSGTVAVSGRTMVGCDLGEQTATVGGLVIRAATVPENTITGGTGGDAGDLYVGVDPSEADNEFPPVWDTSVQAQAAGGQVTSRGTWREDLGVSVRGASGGNGFPTGGKGGRAHADCRKLFLTVTPDVIASGGDGGLAPNMDLVASNWREHVSEFLTILSGKRIVLRGGSGGAAFAGGINGANAAGTGRGTSGGKATAGGGRGGDVVDLLGIADEVVPGAGGHAIARGGNGGRGGSASAGQAVAGGDGGEGGSAYAIGGDGGRPSIGGEIRAPGGDVAVVGGNGGNGGDGRPGGAGGPGARATGEGGRGEPEGIVAQRQSGSAGPNGRTIESGEDLYRVIRDEGAAGYYEQKQIIITTISAVSAESGAWGSQLGQVTLGGTAHPIRPRRGQAFAATADEARAFIATNSGVSVYDNPTSGGDRASDLTLLSTAGTSFIAGPIWLNRTTDTLYCAAWRSQSPDAFQYVYAWHNVSQLAADRAADREFRVSNGGGMYRILTVTGSAAADRLMLYAEGGALVTVNNAGARQGTVTEAETFEFPVAAGGPREEPHALDGIRGVGYSCLFSGFLGCIDNVGTLTALARYLAVGTSFEPTIALHLDEQQDRMFVVMEDGRVLLYNNISTRSGQTTVESPPDKTFNLGHELTSAGLWPVA